MKHTFKAALVGLAAFLFLLIASWWWGPRVGIPAGLVALSFGEGLVALGEMNDRADPPSLQQKLRAFVLLAVITALLIVLSVFAFEEQDKVSLRGDSQRASATTTMCMEHESFNKECRSSVDMLAWPRALLVYVGIHRSSILVLLTSTWDVSLGKR